MCGQENNYILIDEIIAGKCYKLLYSHGQGQHSYMIVEWFPPANTGYRSTELFLVNLGSGHVIYNTDNKKKMAHFLNTWKAVEVRLLCSGLRK